MRSKKLLVFLSLLLSFVLLLTGCGSASPKATTTASGTTQPKQKVSVTIGTGEQGGVYYIIGAAIADVVSKNVDWLKVTPEATGGSVENGRLVGAGQVEFALDSGSSAKEALTGTGDFAGKPLPDIRTVGAGGTMYQTVVIRKDSNVKSLADLKGKKIGMGQPGGSSGAIAERMLKAAGLEKNKDYTPLYLSWAEMADALKDKNIDAGIWFAASPASSLLELSSQTPIKFLELPADYIDKVVQAENGGVIKGKLPKEKYPNILTQDMNAIAATTIIVTNKNTPDNVVYAFTKAIYEHTADLTKAHASGADWNWNIAYSGLSGAPIHPGAEKLYKEKGLIK